jgi:hypothetical protein
MKMDPTIGAVPFGTGIEFEVFWSSTLMEKLAAGMTPSSSFARVTVKELPAGITSLVVPLVIPSCWREHHGPLSETRTFHLSSYEAQIQWAVTRLGMCRNVRGYGITKLLGF